MNKLFYKEGDSFFELFEGIYCFSYKGFMSLEEYLCALNEAEAEGKFGK